MLAPSDSLHADNRMGMVGRGNDHCIDILLPVKHDTIVLVSLGFRVEIEHCLHRAVPVDIAKCHNILCLGYILQIAATHSANTDAGNIQFITRSDMSQSGDNMGRDNGQPPHSQRRGFNKGSPADLFPVFCFHG
jgi:hypothetical protein